MSKDKGSKNHKKAPADKSTKGKSVSTYKLEGKTKESPTLAAFIPKPDFKTGDKGKS